MRQKLISTGAIVATALLVGFGLVWAQRPTWLPEALTGGPVATPTGLPSVSSAPSPTQRERLLGAGPGGGRGTVGSGLDRSVRLPVQRRERRAGEASGLQGTATREELLALRAALLDPSDAVRERALEGLARLGRALEGDAGHDLARIVRQLALFDPNPQVRSQAVTALAKVAPPDAVAEVVSEAVEKVLEDKGDRTDDERSKTLDALLGLTDSVDPAVLINALNDPALTEAALSFIEGMLDSPGSAVISELWAGALDTSKPFDLREAYLDALYQHGEEVDEAYEQLAQEIDQADAPYWDQQLEERMKRYANRPACRVPGQWRACIWGNL